tara:strand:- start:2669 stop:3013 length:345 start_codon:yes stop_codon:yes gene_type:complete
MSRLEIILSAILFVSIVFNIGIFVYARAAIARLLSVSEELGDLQQMVNSFAAHAKSVHELEMFYGDEALKYLVEHAVSFSEQLSTFEYIYSLTETETETEEGATVDNEQENKET